MVKMKVFEGFVVALDLDSCTNIKKKQEIKKLVTDNDGQISFVVNRQCNVLVSNIKEKAEDSYKCRLAVKNNIPVVSTDYLYDCVNEDKVLDVKLYQIIADVSTQKFNKGIISTAAAEEIQFKVSNVLKVWRDGDQDIPDFEEDKYDVLDHECFQDNKGNDSKTSFSIIELHASKVEDKITFRISVHSGFISHGKRDKSKEKKEFRFTSNSDVGVSTFLRLCKKLNETMKRVTKEPEVMHIDLGSKGLQMKLNTKKLLDHPDDGEVEELVDEIWNESIGRLEEKLLPASFSLKLNQVDKAESILVQLKKLLKQKEGKTSLRELEKEFYETVPHRKEEQLGDMKSISKKLELCQLLKDLVTVSESTGHSGTLVVSTAKKYKSLGCIIKTLKGEELADVNNKVNGSNDLPERINVLRIFKIIRPIESFKFEDKLGNIGMMFHATRPENVLGILSRGLLLPRIVVDELGGSLTDGGRLGGGIYYADSADTSLKYSKSSKNTGKRYMLLCSVALGSSKDFLAEDNLLESSPTGFDSCHAVGKSKNSQSVFEDDEYVIYSTNQQKLEYLIEFVIDSDHHDIITPRLSKVISTETRGQESVEMMKMISEVTLDEVMNLKNPLDKLKVGLLSKDSDRSIPLKGVHVFVKMIDLVAEVTLLQHYQNDLEAGNSEVKYVFPLDDDATVYGFEAFINNKHIVGEVKEKEQARKEYRQAVRKGQGAYLMDQDEKVQNLFVISVGNLPAGVDAIIKVVYVTQLSVEDGDVCFNLPGCVAPWKEDEALGTETQDLTGTKRVKPSSKVTTFVQVSMEMPFEIKRILSPSHNIRFKKTDTKAVVETARNATLSDGFKLLAMLANIHMPRMWVERHRDLHNSRACMLTFYPEFDATKLTNQEVVFLVDQSNSMFQSEAVTSARQILLLFLHHLSNESLFNIILFGSDFSKLFSWCKPKSKETMVDATDFLKNNSGSMGRSTVNELLYIFHLLNSPTTTRNIIIITDGYLDDESDVFRNVRSFPSKTRLFGVGVGAASNSHFLQNLSRAGRGSHEHFDDRFKSKWIGKVKDVLTKTSQPSITEVSVEWQNFNRSDDVMQAPSRISSIFSGSRQVVFGFVPNCTVATLKANICGQEILTVISTPDLNITTGMIIHRLTASAIIQDWLFGMMAEDKLEDEAIKRMKKNCIINLSIKHSIVTKYTSFVAVEERQKDEQVEKLDVDNLLKQHTVDSLPYMDFLPSICKIKFTCIDGSTLTLECPSTSTSSNLLTLMSRNTRTDKDVVLKDPRDGSIVCLEDCRLSVWECLSQYPDGVVCLPVEDQPTDVPDALMKKKRKTITEQSLVMNISRRRHTSCARKRALRVADERLYDHDASSSHLMPYQEFEAKSNEKEEQNDDDDDEYSDDVTDLGFGLFDATEFIVSKVLEKSSEYSEEDGDADDDNKEKDIVYDEVACDDEEGSRTIEPSNVTTDSVDGVSCPTKVMDVVEPQRFEARPSLIGSTNAFGETGIAGGLGAFGIKQCKPLSIQPREFKAPASLFGSTEDQPKQHDIIDLSVKELCQQPPLPPPLLPPLLPPHGLGFQFSSQRSLFASPANIMDKRISYRGQTIVGRDLSVCFSTKSENQEPRQHNLLLTTVQDLPNFRNIEDIGMTSEIREKLLSLLQLDDDSGHMFWDLTDELDSTFGINSLLIKQQINGQFSHVYSEEVGGMMNLYRTYATSLTFIKILTSYLTELSELHQTGMENREFTRMILRKIPLRHAQSFLAVYYYLMEMLHDYARFVKEFEDPMWRDAMSFTNEHLYVELML